MNFEAKEQELKDAMAVAMNKKDHALEVISKLEKENAELKEKLTKCQDIAMCIGIKYNEQQDKLAKAIEALEFYRDIRRNDSVFLDSSGNYMEVVPVNDEREISCQIGTVAADQFNQLAKLEL